VNILLPKQFHIYAAKISPMWRQVTDNADQSTANYGECCSSVALPPHL
jgi:hypothetical protein